MLPELTLLLLQASTGFSLQFLSKADGMHFAGDISETYLPANDMDDEIRVAPAAFHRVYNYRLTKFRFSFNPSTCYRKNHTVILAFMHHFPDPTRTKKPLLNNSIMLTKKMSVPEGVIPIATTKFSYDLTTYVNGKKINVTNVNISMMYGNTYIDASDQSKIMFKRYIPVDNELDTKDLSEIPLKHPQPRYIALFASNMKSCPTFISAVDAMFDVWLPKRHINVKGRQVPTPENTTVLRDVILAFLFIVFYYYCLTSFVLPAYFHHMMRATLAQERTLQTNETEEPTKEQTKQEPTKQEPAKQLNNINDIQQQGTEGPSK